MITAYRRGVRIPALWLQHGRSAVVTLLVSLILSYIGQTEVFAANATAGKNEALSAIQRQSVISVLRIYVGKSRFGPDRSTRYSAVAIPNTRFIVAYLQGSTWCGSGGCTLLILKPSGSSYEVRSKIFSVHAPIMNLGKITNGLPEFGGWVQGGGIDVGYEVVLAANHNGKYPFSATMAKKHISIQVGDTLINAADQGATLLP